MNYENKYNPAAKQYHPASSQKNWSSSNPPSAAAYKSLSLPSSGIQIAREYFFFFFSWGGKILHSFNGEITLHWISNDPDYIALQAMAAEWGRAHANMNLSLILVPRSTVSRQLQKGFQEHSLVSKESSGDNPVHKVPHSMCLTSSQLGESGQVRNAYSFWFHFCSCIRSYISWHL